MVMFPSSIVADGSAEVSAALNEFIGNLPPNTVLTGYPDQLFHVEQSIVFPDLNNVVLNGNGATFACKEPRPSSDPNVNLRRKLFQLQGGTNVVISDVNLQGCNPHADCGPLAHDRTLEGQHGIGVYGTLNYEVANVNISNVYGDALYNAGNATNGYAHGGRWKGTGRHGITNVGASFFRGIGLSLDMIGFNCIDIEIVVGIVSNSFILANSCIGKVRDVFAGITGNGNLKVVGFLSNVLTGSAMTMIVTGPAAPRHSGLYVLGNISDKLGRGIDVKNWDGINVTANHCPLQHGFTNENCTDVTDQANVWT